MPTQQKIPVIEQGNLSLAYPQTSIKHINFIRFQKEVMVPEVQASQSQPQVGEQNA